MPMTHLKTPKHKFSTHLINVDDIEKNRGIIEEKHTHKDIYMYTHINCFSIGHDILMENLQNPINTLRFS